MTEPRQRIIRVAGSRRAKLTAVDGSTVEPAAAVRNTSQNEKAAETPNRSGASTASGPNDARLRADVPPHY